MANRFRSFETHKQVAARVVVNAYATGAPPVLIFPCKDIPDLTKVTVKCSGGPRVAIVSRVRNQVTVRVYNDWVNYLAVVGGIVVHAGVGNALDYTGGPFNDDVTLTPGEIPNGSAMTIEGIAEGI